MPAFIEHKMIKPNTVESRLYQEVLAARVIEKGNTLVVAPTSLGKTIVAVLVAAHSLAKNPDSKILILAPTKPLAQQHEKSFQNFLEINPEEIVLLTGSTDPEEREKIWSKAKIICATPQTIENDLITSRVSLKDVSLLVFDEAHKGVKEYSYVFIANKYIKQARDPLILALTASPSSEEEKIQDLCKNLFIKNIEIKTEKDFDVAPFTNEIEITWVKVDLPPEFLEIKRLLEIFMKEQLIFLKKIGYARTINSSFFGKKQMLELQQRIRKDLAFKAKTQPSIYAAASRLAALLKVSHAHTLLESQGISPLSDYIDSMNEQLHKKPSKALKYLLNDDGISLAFQLAKKLQEKKTMHPKVGKLREILSDFFSKNPQSKALVFNHYRSSISTVEQNLRDLEIVKAVRFIGQATKGKDKGLSQKEQAKIIQEFKDGKYNTMICSSVAEEGLDIPNVDLVVFFEPVPSEIRLIQRRGRTGRFGKGNVVILLAKSTRDESYYYSSMAKERKMQSTLLRLKKDSVLEKQSTLLGFVEAPKEQVLIYVDNREQASSVVKELEELGALLKMRQLDVGDYVISDDVVIERKTIEDFLESLIDGRLFNQLVGMASNHAAPLVLVEGDMNDIFSLRNVHRNAIIGALSSIALNYRVPVLFTKDAKETAEFVYLIAKREQLKGEKEIRLRVGRKGLSMPLMQRFIMESFPTVGPVLAQSLLKKFGSIKKFANATDKELTSVDKLGDKKAKQILDVLNKDYEEQ